jgi:predicted RNase H-like HicB family nuclease
MSKALIRDWLIDYETEITPSAHGGFMALSPEFQLAASGKTEEEARDRLSSIILSFGDALARLGKLEEALDALYIRKEPVGEGESDDE